MIQTIILIILIIIGISLAALKPKQLRKIYPGWEYIESRMWDNELCRKLLMALKGPEYYEKAHKEWLENSKYGRSKK